MRPPPYLPVRIYDAKGRFVELREGDVVDLGEGRLAVKVGDLPAGWSAVVAVRVEDE